MSEPLEEQSPLATAAWSDLPAPRPPAALSASIRAATSGLVRRRAQRRRWRTAAGFALAYAAGLASALAWPTAPRPAPRAPQQAAQPAKVDRAAPAAAVEVAALDPEQLRRRVIGAQRSEQIRLLRLAGDRYLYDSADVRSALDCYRQVVELTPEEKLPRPDPQDNWLLAELKLSAAAKATAPGD